MQRAMAQFVRSIQSFDSRYDEGRAQVNNDGQPFPNFTQQENQGKQLFLGRPQFQGPNRVGGGVGCAGCHQPPEFDIAPNSRNNGVVQVAAGSNDVDLTNTRSPTLRDMFNPVGDLSTPLMHNGLFSTMGQVLNHYNSPPPNPQIDRRLLAPGPGNQRANFNITNNERAALVAFMQTLSGTNVYIDERWGDPFVEPPPGVEEIIVETGLDSRSMVTNIVLMFNREVATSANSFSLNNTTDDMSVALVHQSTLVDGKSVVMLTFGSGDSVVTRDSGNSLADGQYELTVVGNQVTAGAEAMSGDVVFSGVNDMMYRLYGDANGDHAVDYIDFAEHFLPAFATGTGLPGFRDDLDFNGDGNVDYVDFSQGFLPNFGTGFTAE